MVLKDYQCGISDLNGSPEAVTHPQIHGLNCLYVNARMRFCQRRAKRFISKDVVDQFGEVFSNSPDFCGSTSACRDWIVYPYSLC